MKKIFYSLIVFLSLFIFTNKAEAAVEYCLYEATNGDGDMIILRQDVYNTWDSLWQENYKAFAYPYGKDITIGDYTFYIDNRAVKDFQMESDQSDELTGFAAYNKKGTMGDSWTEQENCMKFMTVDSDEGSFPKAFLCEDLTDCRKGAEVFQLVDAYEEKSPNYVSLKELNCVYESKDANKETFTFKINGSKNEYVIMDDFKELYTNTFDYDNVHKGAINVESKDTDIYGGTVIQNNNLNIYYDSYSIRSFWNPEMGYYACPDGIGVAIELTSEANFGFLQNPNYNDTYVVSIGYLLDGERIPSDYSYQVMGNKKIFGIFKVADKHVNFNYTEYDLVESVSYVTYDTDYADINSCIYTYEDLVCDPSKNNCEVSTRLDLTQRSYNKQVERDVYATLNQSFANGKYIINEEVLKNLDLSSCEKAKEIYTDCFTTSSSGCYVSLTGTDIYDERGFKLNSTFEKLVPNDWSNTQSYIDAQAGVIGAGYRYKKLLCALNDRLQVNTPRSILNSAPLLDIYTKNGEKEEITKYNINNLNCNDWGFRTGYSCNSETCLNQLSYSIDIAAHEIKDYCTDVYNLFLDLPKDEGYFHRKEECISYSVFYDYMVRNGIITDLSSGCDFVTDELGEKLTFVLDLLKIAGPILALGLGTLDFIKAIASGDSDKEMKTAFKRFYTRILAAILLFIIPIILAFLMDTFIGNKDGYDPNNPFCKIVDWED